MNLGCSWCPAWSQELRVQSATPGRASTKVSKRQVPAATGKGRPETGRVSEGLGRGESVEGRCLRNLEGLRAGKEYRWAK